MESLKTVGIIGISVFIFIICVTSEKVRQKIYLIVNKKIFKSKITIKNIILVILGILTIIWAVYSLRIAYDNFKFVNKDMSKELDELNETLEISKTQGNRYKELMKMETNIENCKNPYIPDGFHYVEGNWDTGFVIADENENQFVWVPCTNKDNNEEIPILKKDIFSDDNVSYFSCYEQEDYEEFIISCLQNGGFYISRFEIGNIEGKPVSKFGAKIWTNVNWNEANSISNGMYDSINSRLINGYAIDAAISFVLNNTNKNKFTETTGTSGTECYKNIYDLLDNMLEWTSEMKHGLVILRGTVWEIDEETNAYLYSLFCERFANVPEFTGEKLGFRTIIYR